MANQMVFKRYELKYLMTRRQQQAVLAAMQRYMALDKYGHTSIRNIYYDTPNYLLIRRSLEKPIYKEKLRVRSYGRAAAGDAVFVELKKKYKGVVCKRRLCLPNAQAEACLQGDMYLPDTQIGREIAYTMQRYEGLQPALFLSYEREAFYSKDGSDFRITFDENIRYRQHNLTLDSDPDGIPLLGQDMVLMEIKTPAGIPLWLTHLLSQQKIYKTSFSKYGAAYQKEQLLQRKGTQNYA